MISKWGDFIIEKKIMSLILEADCKSSASFILRLKPIVKKSKIASIIYDYFDSEEWLDDELDQNWIDVTDRNDMISFLSDEKADKLEMDDDSEPYKAKGRGEIKIGRFARAFISALKDADELPGTDFTDKDYEEFVNLYKSTFGATGEGFSEVTGKDIRKYYNNNNYAADKGTLGGSCMADEECENYFDIYVKNPAVCSLLVLLTKEKKVLGRALVWKLHKSPCEATHFMDRVYTASDSDVNKFISYAEEKGWMYKWRMNSHCDEGLIFKYGGKSIVGKIEVKLSKCDFDQYPFLDTLSFLNVDKKILCNANWDPENLILDGTNGSDFTSECNHCDDGTINGECTVCNGEGFAECPDCSGTGKSKCLSCHGEGHSNKEVECPDCLGAGKVKKLIRNVTCQSCKGSGVVYEVCDECDGGGDVDCKKCDGDGDIKCKVCDGVGDVDDADCPECILGYQRGLEELIGSGSIRNSSIPKEIRSMAKVELEKDKKEREEKKKKKKK
jgi:hypothetical protein